MIIKKISRAAAPYKYATKDILPYAHTWLQNTPKEYELFEKVSQGSKITHRNFAIPLEQVINLKGITERAEIFMQAGTELASQAVSALGLTSEDFAQIDNLLFSSCSFPLIPTIDCALINKFPFRKNINRLPLFQYGCVGGVSGLRLSNQLAGSGKTLLVSAEICSLIFQRADTSRTQVIGGALFADGAAAILLEPEAKHGIEIVASSTYLIPESLHLMGYDWSDSGAHLRLDQKLPFAVAAESKKLISQFLESINVSTQDLAYWLIHPGGIKILDLLESLFELDLKKTSFSHQIMETYGNMSSATILHVLDEFNNSSAVQSGDLALMLGIGPGLTIELILLRKV